MGSGRSAIADEVRRLHGRGRHGEAARTLRDWLVTAPGDREARALLAASLLELGDAEEALRQLERLVAASPDDAELRRLQGDALFRLGRVEEASEALERAATIDRRPRVPGLDEGSAPGDALDGLDLDAALATAAGDLEDEPTQVHAHLPSPPGDAPGAPPPPAPAGAPPPIDARPPLEPPPVASAPAPSEPSPPRVSSPSLAPLDPPPSASTPAPSEPSPPRAAPPSAAPLGTSIADLVLDDTDVEAEVEARPLTEVEFEAPRPSRPSAVVAPPGSPGARPSLGASLDASASLVPLGAPSLPPGTPAPRRRGAPSLAAPAPPRRGRVGVIAAVALVVALAGAAGAWLWWGGPLTRPLSPAAAAAVEAARRNGTRDGFAAALAAAGDADALRGLHAALAAARLVELGEGDPGRVQASVAGAGDDREARIARAWLALGAGDPGPASALPVPEEPRWAGDLEVAILGARAALLRGDDADARRVLSAFPAAPRARALAARAVAAGGGPEAGLRALPAPSTPGLTLTRAELLAATPGGAEEAAGLARALVDGSRAARAERARAWRLLAADAVARGALGTAAEAVRAAWEAPPPAVPGFALGVAELALAAGVLDVAGKAAEAAEAAPDAARLRRLRFDLALAAGRLDDAAARLEEVPEAARGDGPWRLRAGRLALAEGRPREAQRLLEPLVEAPDPELGVEARLALARVAGALGLTEARAGLLAEAAGETPPHPDAVFLHVAARIEDGEPAAARAAAAAALEARPRAVRLEAALGLALLAEGQRTEAAARLEAAARERPSDVPVQVAWGRAARGVGRLDAAAEAFDAALAGRPGHPEALAGRIDVAIARREVDLLRSWRDAVGADALPPALAAWARGALAVLEGRGHEALADARAAADAHGTPELVATAARLAAQAGDHALAARLFREAIALRPTAEAHLGLALAEVRQGVLARAAALVAEAQRLAAAAGDAERVAIDLRLVRAWIQIQVGNAMDAETEARRAISLDADDGRAQYALARVFLARDEDALGVLERAVAGHHPPPEAHAHLALALGRGEAACLAATRARARAPGYEAARLRRVDCAGVPLNRR